MIFVFVVIIVIVVFHVMVTGTVIFIHVMIHIMVFIHVSTHHDHSDELLSLIDAVHGTTEHAHINISGETDGQNIFHHAVAHVSSQVGTWSKVIECGKKHITGCMCK